MSNSQPSPEIIKKLLFITENHPKKKTTDWMAKEIGEKPSWVEAQISMLLENGLLTPKKRPPEAKVLEILKKAVASQQSSNMPAAPVEPSKEQNNVNVPVEKSASEKGVPPGWILTSVVIQKERLAAIADLAWYRRCHKREIQDEAFAEYIERHHGKLQEARRERQKQIKR